MGIYCFQIPRILVAATATSLINTQSTLNECSAKFYQEGYHTMIYNFKLLFVTNMIK